MSDWTTRPISNEPSLTSELPQTTAATRALPETGLSGVDTGLSGVDTGLSGVDTGLSGRPDSTDLHQLDQPVRRGIRLRTVVFGLVMAAVAAACQVALLTNVHVDAAVVGLVLLIAAGAALVAGGIAAAVRESRGGPGATR